MRNVLRRSRASSCGATALPCWVPPPLRREGVAPVEGTAAADEPLSATDGKGAALSLVVPRAVVPPPVGTDGAWPAVLPAPVPDTMDADVAATSNTMAPVGDPGSGRTPVCVTSRPVEVNPPAIG